eukprot:gene3039-2224_t
MHEQVRGGTSMNVPSEADIENFRKSLAADKSGAHEDFETRRSTLERESLSRLTVEGHVAFDSEKLKLILPSPNYPHNSGKRVNRRLRECIRRNFESLVRTCLDDGADPLHRVTFAFSILNEAIVTPCSDQIVGLLIERFPSLVNAPLAFFTAFFLLLPSVFICLIPYQSVIERFLTVIQMRIVYEGLISMGQERLTVRFGATQMYHTVLQNVPQAMMQSFMLALVLRGENNFGGDRTSLILAILTTVYQSTATFHNMYLLRFFVKDHDAGTEPIALKIALTIGVMLGVILRVTMWASILLTQPGVIIILLSWFGRQLLDLYLLAWSNLLFTMTILWLEAKDAWAKLRPTQTTAAQQQQQQDKASNKNRNKLKNATPVAPPLIQERVWRMLCACPQVSWEHLEPREMMSMGLVAVIILLLIFYLFALVVGQCEQVSSTLGSDDYLETPRENTDHGIHCASYFSAQMGYFCIGVAPYLLIVFAFGYIVEAVTCHVALSLRNLCHEERGFNQYLQARAKPPSFKWFSESFHYETRTETYTESDGRGGTRTATRTVTVRVVTHTATAYYSFDYWLDDSAPFPHSHPLCRVQSVNQYQFDAYTREDYNAKYAQFKSENDRDTHQNCSDTFLIGNSTQLALPAMMIFSEEAPYFLRYTYYLCAMLVLQAPYYRWAVAGMSEAVSVPIVKMVRVCPPDDPVLTNFLLRYGDKDVEDVEEEEEEDAAAPSSVKTDGAPAAPPVTTAPAAAAAASDSSV